MEHVAAAPEEIWREFTINGHLLLYKFASDTIKIVIHNRLPPSLHNTFFAHLLLTTKIDRWRYPIPVNGNGDFLQPTSVGGQRYPNIVDPRI